MPHSLSLKGLQALEAAARLGSFAAAAEALSVSPAAVSQLIRGLEDQVGRKLFHRINRGITPTEAGREVLPRLSIIFDELRSVSGQLTGGGGRPSMTVSVPPSVATGWLSTRIPEFILDHGPGNISIRGEEDPVAFERDSIDVRMTYGRFHYLDHSTEEIATDCAVPACSPAFLARYGPFETAEQLLNAPLIHTDWGPSAATFPTWRSWFEAASVLPEKQIDGGMSANSSKAAIDLAINGLGIVLCQGFFATGPINEGLLVQPIEKPVSLAQPYCLTIPQRSATRSIVKVFRTWFIQQCLASIIAPLASPLTRPMPIASPTTSK
ncbi:MAG: LysR substrate-binding domain-containing protein [Pseudomonadota bacterium]